MRSCGPPTPTSYAVGDVVEVTDLRLTGEPVLSMLAGPANREGRIAADTISGRDSALPRDPGHGRSSQVFDMTAAVHRACPRPSCSPAGRRRTARSTSTTTGTRRYYPGTAPMFIKLLFEPGEGKMLGAQIVG